MEGRSQYLPCAILLQAGEKIDSWFAAPSTPVGRAAADKMAVGATAGGWLVWLLLAGAVHRGDGQVESVLFPESTAGGVGPWNLQPPFPAGHPISEAQPGWELGTAEAPVVFTEWKCTSTASDSE